MGEEVMVKAAAALPVVDGERSGETYGETCCASVLAAPLDWDTAAGLARGFAALSDPARLQILSILSASPAGEVCVCEFVQPLGKSQPTVSHHLKVLADAQLVEGERRGKWVWYRIAPGRLDSLRTALTSS